MSIVKERIHVYCDICRKEIEPGCIRYRFYMFVNRKSKLDVCNPCYYSIKNEAIKLINNQEETQ